MLITQKVSVMQKLNIKRYYVSSSLFLKTSWMGSWWERRELIRGWAKKSVIDCNGTVIKTKEHKIGVSSCYSITLMKVCKRTSVYPRSTVYLYNENVFKMKILFKKNPQNKRKRI